MLNIVSIAVRVVSRVELEPAINNPHLASSLQDFWGKRWNLMVTNILRLTIYDPVRSVIKYRIPRRWAPIPAVLATFFVSGLMHELFFYYIGRLKPSGEAMMFFLIHGVALSVEIVIKKMFNGKFLVPRIISGPLSSTPPLPLSTFIPLACLPIKFKKYSINDNAETKKKTTKSTLNHITKIALLAIFIRVYSYKDYLHPKIILSFYCFHIYFMLEIIFNMISAVVRGVSRVELEPPFDEPYLASSLQDFWGKRWNLMVTNIFRPTVYDPVCLIVADRISRKWAPLLAVLATFFVSGLMHELIFNYNGRLMPNGMVN
ncbi:hypothetical protein KY285_006706 [Solanum tuberosum]|nr:hypothetical protein KY285_006706 [Solanum tuberosum]